MCRSTGSDDGLSALLGAALEWRLFRGVHAGVGGGVGKIYFGDGESPALNALGVRVSVRGAFIPALELRYETGADLVLVAGMGIPLR